MKFLTVKNLLAMFALSLMTFFCNLIWGSFEEQAKATKRVEDSLTATNRRIEDLEKAETQWGTLADHEESLRELSINYEVMRRVWEYEYGRKIPTGAPAREKYEEAEEDEPMPLMPLPVPVAPNAPVDPGQFRQMQQNRYPTKK